MVQERTINKCRKCKGEYKPYKDAHREHRGLCPYCVIRFELGFWAKDNAGKRRAYKLSNEQIDKGIERLQAALVSSSSTFEEFSTAMAVAAKAFRKKEGGKDDRRRTKGKA